MASDTVRDDTAELVAFVRARLDEDEAAAQSAEHAHPPVGWAITYDPETMHSVRHDPACVLREVETKRQIVNRYEAAARSAAASNGWDSDLDWKRARAHTLQVVCEDLAGLYRDHPDYPAYLRELRP